jgi:ribosomal protein S18 acetylase RimI-like enzyme/transcription antitermination factor NusG
MSDLKYFPISHLDESCLLPLMEEEEKMWMSDLCWDYSPIRHILVSFVKQKLLPGYVAVNAKKAVGYTYFLVNQAKGIIGALYASKTNQSQEAVEQLLSLSISCLKDSQNIQRVEAQIMPFHNLNLAATFTQYGFTYYPRYYLDLNLDALTKKDDFQSPEKVIPWSSTYLERLAEMTSISYRNQTDAEICEDYRTKTGCESYLRSLVDNPGCGIFMPEASFIGLDEQGSPCGFVICCRISDTVGMIPQIAVHSSYQGRGLGNALIKRCFQGLQSLGFHNLSLTVTKKNRRAYEWYQRLGFKIRKEFGAYVWQR